jgi:hypothetical protein
LLDESVRCMTQSSVRDEANRIGMYAQALPLTRAEYSAARSRTHGSTFATLVFFAAHIPLALSMRAYPAIGLVHALAAVALALWWTTKRNRPELVVLAAGYIAGAEVLWRMTGSPLFWEFGKYAVAMVFMVAIVIRQRFKAPALPLFYFALLLVSVAFSTSGMDFEKARNQISFNLSGPFALAVSAWFFSQIQLSRGTILRLFAALLGPTIGIGSIALLYTLSARERHFANASNFITSGGFGPNQVSAILGLGALLAYLYVLDREVSFNLRVVMLGLVLIFATQSALTFSRGGLYVAVGSVMAASLYQIRTRQTRVKFALAAVFMFAVAYYVVLPRLDAFSEGLFSVRFESTKSAGRDRFATAELRAWQENPVFGLGPGGAELYRQQEMTKSGLAVASHTEYTRLLAEHGLLGLEALILLLVACLQNVRRTRTSDNKAVLASLIAWSLLFMAVNGMRLVAPSLLLGLSFATLLSDQGKQLVEMSRLKAQGQTWRGLRLGVQRRYPEMQ